MREEKQKEKKVQRSISTTFQNESPGDLERKERDEKVKTMNETRKAQFRSQRHSVGK